MIDPDAALAFLGFVEARHTAWEKRQAGLPAPWTDEPIVATRKFTNVFRVLDYGSQFVTSTLLDPELSARDQLARLFLYRHTGRVEVWEYLELMLGRYPTVDDLQEVLQIWQEYRGETRITQRGQEARNSPGEKRTFQRSVFTGAYLVFPQTHDRGSDKLESIVDLTRRLFHPDSDQDVVPEFLAADSPALQFAILRRNKGVADFMSMQVLTDWGYSPQCGQDREDDFVQPGPGAVKGAAALDPHAKPMDVLHWAVETIRSSPGCPTLPLDSYGEDYRVPSYMDAQNCLCEFSKWVRFAAKPLPAKPYQPAHPGPQEPPVLPKHW